VENVVVTMIIYVQAVANVVNVEAVYGNMMVALLANYVLLV
jgi:hypothetical protein